MLLHHVAPSCCSTMLLHHAAPPCCSTMLHHHAAPPCCSTMLLHHAAPPCCSTMLLHHVAPPCCSTMLLHHAAPPCIYRSPEQTNQTGPFVVFFNATWKLVVVVVVNDCKLQFDHKSLNLVTIYIHKLQIIYKSWHFTYLIWWTFMEFCFCWSLTVTVANLVGSLLNLLKILIPMIMWCWCAKRLRILWKL